MKISIGEARSILTASLTTNGYLDAEAAIIADHLMDCELRGLGYAGLARGLSIIEHDHRAQLVRRPITILRDTPVSALLDGGDDLGYLVAMRATELAIQKCRAAGIAVVGASKTHFTGMYSYYLEKVTAAGFVGMIAGSGPSTVAPHGATEPRFSTNPIAFGFPADDVPVIWDISTSSITHAETQLAIRAGMPLPAGKGYDAAGMPTTDPRAVLDGGTMAVWGGHRGSGLALSIQLLSMMAGQRNVFGPWAEPADFGYLMIVIDPGLFGSQDDFKRAVTEYAGHVRQARPLDPDVPVRVPFERSAEERRLRLAEGSIEVSDLVVDALRSLTAEARVRPL